MRIFEFPPNVMRSPLEGYETEKSRMEEERRRDAELAAEIALRKKGTNERNVKLTVVLMASRRLLGERVLPGISNNSSCSMLSKMIPIWTTV